MSARSSSPAALGLIACALAGCASAPPPPGTQAPLARLEALAVPGASREQVRAAFGPTTHLRFDNGNEVWRYQVPAGAGRFSEYVILFGPDGTVRKTRRRDPDPFDTP